MGLAIINMFRKIKKNLKEKGFTLIELLVALSAFLILVTLVSSSAVSLIKAQRKAIAMQDIGEQIGYVLETISKEVRMGKVVSSSGSSPILSVVNSSDEDIDYRFSSNKIQRRVNGGVWQDLTQTKAAFNGSFQIEKYGGSPGNRAKVTIIMQVEYQLDTPGQAPELNLQTTISSRSSYN